MFSFVRGDCQRKNFLYIQQLLTFARTKLRGGEAKGKGEEKEYRGRGEECTQSREGEK